MARNRDGYEELVNGLLPQKACGMKWSTGCLWMLITTILAFSFLAILFVISPDHFERYLFPHKNKTSCEELRQVCHMQLVESIPEGLTYNQSLDNLSTFQAWKTLLKLTGEKLELASSYWSLRGQDIYQHPSDWQGEDIFKSFVKATERGIRIDIAQNLQHNPDTADLAKIAGVRVRSLNFTALMGAGILHTKLWIADRKHFYVGSANFDWRSLTQVKELGVLVTNCSCMANDMAKIWQVYWDLGGAGKHVPISWPATYETKINASSPMTVINSKDNSTLQTFLSSSPPAFCPKGREIDIEAILNIINEAEEFVHVAVMDYFPTTLYQKKLQFWPRIDDALRRAAVERGVQVKLLLSKWNHTRSDMIKYLKSLTDLTGINHDRCSIEGKLFEIPASPDQAQIPYARVNHNKYLVTEKTAYIGTSNWSADYFINTGGIGFVVWPQNASRTHESSNLHRELSEVFMRDWNSSYAHGIN